MDNIRGQLNVDNLNFGSIKKECAVLVSLAQYGRVSELSAPSSLAL